MDIPTLTFTRTIIQFVRDGTVVNEIVIEPWEKLTVEKIMGIGPEEKVALIVFLIQQGKYNDVENILRLPPYLKLILPSSDITSATLPFLVQTISQALDPEYRKSMLIRYIQERRSEIISQAEERGIPKLLAERLLDRYVNEIKSLNTLEEVMDYENRDPVDYITSLARIRVPTMY